MSLPREARRPSLDRVPRAPDIADPRFVRLRRLAWILDRSIPVGGGYRIGVDPLIGLLPGVGDALGVALSSLILYDAARLGLPVHVLLRMAGNVLLEAVFGAVPVIGDLFDFVWHANVRNLALVEKHYDPLRAPRPAQRIAWMVGSLAVVVALGLTTFAVIILQALWEAVDRGW